MLKGCHEKVKVQQTPYKCDSIGLLYSIVVNKLFELPTEFLTFETWSLNMEHASFKIPLLFNVNYMESEGFHYHLMLTPWKMAALLP